MAENDIYGTICNGCDNPEITHKCDKCSWYLCMTCAKSHGRAKATKSHELDVLTNSTKATSSEPVPAYCLDHHDKVYNLFCDYCKDIICPECKRSSYHAGHKTSPVTQSNKQLKLLCVDKLRTTLSAKISLSSTNMLPTREESFCNLNDMKKRVGQNCAKLQKFIKITSAKALNEIDNEMTRIKTEWDSFDKSRTEHIQQANDLENSLFGMRNCEETESLVNLLRKFKCIFKSMSMVAGPSVQESIRLRLKVLDTPEIIESVESTIEKVIVPHRTTENSHTLTQHQRCHNITRRKSEDSSGWLQPSKLKTDPILGTANLRRPSTGPKTLPISLNYTQETTVPLTAKEGTVPNIHLRKDKLPPVGQVGSSKGDSGSPRKVISDSRPDALPLIVQNLNIASGTSTRNSQRSKRAQNQGFIGSRRKQFKQSST